jgi:hypothetical protein
VILHQRAQRLLDELSAAGRLGGPEVASVVACHPCFQNLDYPLAHPPLLIDSAALPQITALTEAYVALLEKLIGLYRTTAEIRRFMDLGAAAEELIDAEGAVDRAITVCRLDGYVDRVSGQIRILENNADSPAGTLFTPRLNRLTRTLIGEHFSAPPLLPMDDGDPFLDLLLSSVAPFRRDGRPLRAAVLQMRGRANRESHEVAAALHALGQDCQVIDPRDMILTDDGLGTVEGPLDLVWNKINTAIWNELVTEAPGIVDTFAQAARHAGAPVMLNAYGARHVAEAKTSLALLHTPRFAGFFTAAERSLIEALVPWTAKLERDAVVRYEGDDWPLEKLLIERQRDLVLKDRYDIRGDGVTIGRAESAERWRDKLAAAWNSGTSVQRHVEPAQYAVRLAGDDVSADLNVSLDSFVFGGRLVGLGAKASPHAKVNLFQGGSKLSVLLVPDE